MTKSESYIRNSITSFVAIIVNFILDTANVIFRFSLVLFLVYYLELCIFAFWNSVTNGNIASPNESRSETASREQSQDEIAKIQDELLNYDLGDNTMAENELFHYEIPSAAYANNPPTFWNDDSSDTEMDKAHEDVPIVDETSTTQNTHMTPSSLANISDGYIPDDDVPNSSKSSSQANLRT